MRKYIVIDGKKERIYSWEEILKQMRKRKGFEQGYQAELLRLRLAHEVKVLREKKKMTQKQVAKAADMPQPVVARIENGKRGITVDTLGKVAHALGKKVQLV